MDEGDACSKFLQPDDFVQFFPQVILQHFSQVDVIVLVFLLLLFSFNLFPIDSRKNRIEFL